MSEKETTDNAINSKTVSDALLLGSKSKSEVKLKEPDISRWYAQMNYMFINNLNYSYRAKTEAIFKGGVPSYFDFFFVNDKVFD